MQSRNICEQPPYGTPKLRIVTTQLYSHIYLAIHGKLIINATIFKINY